MIFRVLAKQLKPSTPSDHQFCYIHPQRNVRRNMGKEDENSFNKELENIKSAGENDERKGRLERFCQQYKAKFPNFIKYILPEIDNYFFPSDIERR